MKHLKIACTPEAKEYFSTTRELVSVEDTNCTNIAAAVLTDGDAKYINKIYDTRFGIPIFVVLKNSDKLDNDLIKKVYHVIDGNETDVMLYNGEIEAAASKYEESIIPPFFKAVKDYAEEGRLQFDTPGHHGGSYFRKHPTGKAFCDFYGDNMFRADFSSSDPALGDLLTHDGPALDAEKHAAKVYNADKTYFVMNGTSISNSVVTNAVVAPGDLVLFDRNNHKSVYNSALVQSGGVPVYLETSRNPFGFIGGIFEHCFDEKYIRGLVAKIDPEKAKAKRPFRMAVIQLGTYDGTICNAKKVVEKIGHLCDYILFDSAWVGYEQFIPMMRDCSPLLLDLGPEDPGIFVTQSVHKQQAGLSQTSQIHKKDSHIKGQARYVDHKRFNNAYMLHASTSPFYALFAALDVNARMQEGEAGKKLWSDCVKLGIEARKAVFKNCTMLKPFIPPVVDGKKWEDYDTDEIANNIKFFKFEPGAKWHSFDGYGKDQYFVDPNKFMLITPGINIETGEYEKTGVQATILASYLRENGITPEKTNLNSILFLMTPAETSTKMQNLVSHLVKFEQLVKADAPLSEVLPSIYNDNKDRYKGYTIGKLCQEMHDFYKDNNAKTYQQRLFLHDYLPEMVMTPQAANWELVRNHAKLVPLDHIVGEVALEGALPYPPGVFCIAPGERWTEIAQKYFLILQDGINNFPGFSPEIQGVYFEHEGDKVRAYGYVLNK